MKNRLLSYVVFGVVGAAFATQSMAGKVLSADTTAPGGSSGVTILNLAEVASENDIADMQVNTGQTLTNSLQKMVEGNLDITPGPFVLAFFMKNGLGPYSKLGKQRGSELIANARVLFTYRLGLFTLYAYDSSPVKGWDTIGGNRILNGPPRGGALSNARTIISKVTGLEDGKGYTGVQMSWGQMAQGITDGAVDAALLPIALWSHDVTVPLSSGSMTAWSVPKSTFESASFNKIFKIGLNPVTIPMSDITKTKGLTVYSEDDTFRVAAATGGVMVHKDMDFDTAKALTAAKIASFEKLYQKAPFMKFGGFGDMNPLSNGMCGTNPVPYHPGAVAAWEQAGYTVPECAKP